MQSFKKLRISNFTNPNLNKFEPACCRCIKSIGQRSEIIHPRICSFHYISLIYKVIGQNIPLYRHFFIETTSSFFFLQFNLNTLESKPASAFKKKHQRAYLLVLMFPLLFQTEAQYYKGRYAYTPESLKYPMYDHVCQSNTMSVVLRFVLP